MLALTESLVIAQTSLPADLQPALEKINQPSITSTISFLASDEMAGRDTPSKELDIAGAYVAARFRGAGLDGGGDQKTFFQTTTVATVQLPASGISLLQNGKSIQHFGLLGGDANPFAFSGIVTAIDADVDFRNQKFTGPVYFTGTDWSNPRAVSNLARQTAILKRNGATAILIPVDSENPIVKLAAKKLEPTLVQPRGGYAGPTLLVAEFDNTAPIDIQIPKQTGGTASVRNVIGVLPGSDPEFSQQAILFTAHLDHIGYTDGAGDTIFNGADDDATGVTAVLTLADAFAALPNRPKRTLIFMTYWGEEKGLLGSAYWAKHPTWPLEKIVANINIEMIGRPEPGANEKVWVTGWQYSNLGPLMNQGSQSVKVLTFEHPKFSEMLYRASDNYSLVEKGVIAHSFSAGSLHGDYHQVTDEWERLELRHMTRVIEGLFAGSLPIANAEQTPVPTKN